MATNIIDLQKLDHVHLDRLFKRYGDEPNDARRATFRELVDLVTTHAFAEEEVLFPAARRALASGEQLTAEIESQHQRINELLTEMEGMEPGDEGFDRRVDELFPLLRADVRNEEDRLLPAMAERLDPAELERIGAAWAVAKKAAPNRSHPRVPRRPPGNVLAGIPLYVIDHVRSAIARLRNTSQ